MLHHRYNTPTFKTNTLRLISNEGRDVASLKLIPGHTLSILYYTYLNFIATLFIRAFIRSVLFKSALHDYILLRTSNLTLACKSSYSMNRHFLDMLPSTH